MGQGDRSRHDRLWDTHNAADEGKPDISAHENLRAVQLLLGHTKLESTVKYLGIEVDDALEMAEQTEV
jgi:hypothetical protein